MTFRIKVALLITTLATLLAGCANDAPGPAATESAGAASATERGGAELWAANCSRCHNIRPPQSFSDAQWQTIVHHMRLRANLTGQEVRTIAEFLQSSN